MYSNNIEIEYSSSKDWGEDAIVQIKESERAVPKVDF